jgi:ABC-type branched-subunit amino acid transport system substrate-binding protein
MKKLVVAVLAALCASSVLAQQRQPIKIGAMIPLTGGGATVGESGQIAVELAVRNINAAGGIAGRPVQLVIADYQTDATSGVSEAKRLVYQEKVDIMVGPTYSQVTLAVLPILNEAKIATINVSGSERLTPEVGPYAFSMLANAEAQSKLMVDYAVRSMKVQSAAILTDVGAQAKTAVEAMKAELAARKITH